MNNYTFRYAMLRLAAADMLVDDVAGAELWLSLTEPPGGQPWRFEHIGGDLEERHMWGVEIEWRGENVHLIYGDYGGSFSGIVKPDLTSEEDEIEGITQFLDSMAHFSNPDSEDK
jgi:hypothetical protein